MGQSGPGGTFTDEGPMHTNEHPDAQQSDKHRQHDCPGDDCRPDCEQPRSNTDQHPGPQEDENQIRGAGLADEHIPTSD